MKWLAKIYLWRVKPYVVVVAGTTGRYWIKEAISEAFLEKGITTRSNQKNFNAEIGLPLSVLGLGSGEKNFWKWIKILCQALKIALLNTNYKLLNTSYLVLEMAIDKPQNMDYLLSIVRPNSSVFTTITMVYRENFESLDEISLEYQRLIKSLPPDGLAILNFDDERVKNLFSFSPCATVSYGLGEGADFRAEEIKKVTDGQTFRVSNLRLKINRFGTHHIYAALVKEIIKEKMPISANLSKF